MKHLLLRIVIVRAISGELHNDRLTYLSYDRREQVEITWIHVLGFLVLDVRVLIEPVRIKRKEDNVARRMYSSLESVTPVTFINFR